MEILSGLFGSTTKVKLIRLFILNNDDVYTLSQITERVRAKSSDVKKELTLLIKIGIIKKKELLREVVQKKKKTIKSKKISEIVYCMDNKFPYLQALKNLLVTVSLNADDTLLKKFNQVGRIRLFVASGLFIQEWDTRVDLLIVGDDMNLIKLESVIESIESEIGKEIIYTAFETTDFEYRVGIHDRLIRDILDSPHTTLVDKLGIESE